MTDWIALAYGTVFPCLILFAVYAVVISVMQQRKETLDTENFITARGSVGKWRIAFSFYAGAVGSWVVTGPANYASYSGLIGCTMYAISAGFPIFFIAVFGNSVVKVLPHAMSFHHYVGWRFGYVAKSMVILIGMFNMGLALLAEYATTGSLFKDYVGSTNLPVIITIGVLTMFYTALGGLHVSIITDRVQAIASLVLIVTLIVYLAIDFRADLPTPLTSDQIGTTYYGYSSILAMPVSMMCATVFNEAMWQRVWASESKKSLYFGAGVASVGVGCVTFLFGFGGWLANWAGYITMETNPNLYWFSLFTGGVDTTLNNAAGLLTLIAAAIMSESAVDSYQNGLTSVVVSTFLNGKDIKYARILVLLINIPLIALACLEIADQVLALFLVGNMITSCCAIPIVSGLVRYDRVERYITEFGVVFAMLFAGASVTIYGVANTPGSFWDGFVYAWYGNMYAWDYFAMAVGTSVGGLVLGCALRACATLCGWKLPEVVRCDVEVESLSDGIPPNKAGVTGQGREGEGAQRPGNHQPSISRVCD